MQRWIAVAAAVVIALATLVTTQGIGAADASPACTLASGQRLKFSSQGVTREYDLRIPPGGATSQTPLMLSLHPLGFTLEFQRDFSRFAPSAGSDNALPGTVDAPSADVAAGVAAAADVQRLGDREGFIAVFPQGINNQWDLRIGGIDTTFLPELVEYLHTRGCSSPSRTIVSGYSMGAMMTSRLICARPDLFSGAAMVSAVYPPVSGCIVPKRMSIIGIHGTADRAVHWDGTVPPALHSFGIESFPWDRPTMMRMWAEAKGCATAVNGSFFITAATEYAGCPGSTTHMLGIVGGDHGWNMGGISVSEYIWEVLRPAERSPVMSATVALHRAVGDVGTTHSLPISAGATLTIDTGMADATVLGTLTATGAQAPGHLRAYPCNAPLPNASALNYTPGQNTATGAAIHTGPDGRICVYTSATTHILWDQAAETTLPSHTPTRLLDTRTSTPIAAGATLTIDTGMADATVLGTLTATGAQAPGHLRAYPCNAPLPNASALNYTPGQNTATGAAIHTGPDGRICVYTSATTHILWDQAAETTLPSHTPTRLLDTRS